jgi:hypothetical protein
MDVLLKKLKKKLPNIVFEAGDAFFWSPEHATVTYKRSSSQKREHTWALLHEASHALLNHKTYRRDIELLQLEAAAWEQAKQLANELNINISDDHIQDCLDTYRDWLHQRATCPRCSTVSFQVNSREYRCHNCAATWQVTASRFCRPYRLSNAPNKKSPQAVPQATFQ